MGIRAREARYEMYAACRRCPAEQEVSNGLLWLGGRLRIAAPSATRSSRRKELNNSEKEMFKAVMTQDIDKIRQLLDSGVDLECQNKADETPLQMSVSRGKKSATDFITSYISDRKQDRSIVSSSEVADPLIQNLEVLDLPSPHVLS